VCEDNKQFDKRLSYCSFKVGGCMAIVAISRQCAALGDEIAAALAKKIGYRFIDKREIEKKIVQLGFSPDKLKNYDERKPGFFASLAKERDEYLDYLQTAVLEVAQEGNCVLIGRAAHIILDGVPNLFAVRFVADRGVRMARLKEEFNWDDKKALQRIEESDANRLGFYKSFFNETNEEVEHFHLVINTGLFSIDSVTSIVSGAVNSLIDTEQEALGRKKVKEMYEAQKLVNELLFEHKLAISFLRAVIHEDKLVLQGVANSLAITEKAVSIAKEKMPDKTIESCISVVQDFKAFP
jgi:cytidylate kinase